MEKHSNIFEELMYVNKEEEKEKLKNTDIKFAYNDGFAIGKIEGARASKKEIIKNLIDMKMSAEQIAGAVNMPIEEVEMINKKYMAIEM